MDSIVTERSERETIKMIFEARHVLGTKAIRITGVRTTLVRCKGTDCQKTRNQTGRARAYVPLDYHSAKSGVIHRDREVRLQ